MGRQRPTGSILPFHRRAAALAVVSALPLSLVLIAAAPAAAEDHAGTETVEMSVGPTDTVIRIGNVQVVRPDWVSPEQAGEFNTASIGAESALSQALESTGLTPERSDQIAGAILGDAAVGAVVGAAAAAPVAGVGAVIGMVSGVVAGLPFAPIGLVIVPAIGAALGYAMVAAPFAAVGAAVGAAAGAVEGYLASPQPVPQ